MTASLTPATRVHAESDVLFQDLDGEGVLLNLKTGVYFGLDRVSTRVWQLIERPTPIAQIVESLTAEFEVTAERCTADVLALTASLAQHGLVSCE